MKIAMNKDFLEYKEDVVKGFNLREVIFILISLVEVIIATYLLYSYIGLEVNVAIYISIFLLATPTIVGGLYKYQGLYLAELICEILYESKTKILVREMEEYVPQSNCFQMKVERNKKGDREC